MGSLVNLSKGSLPVGPDEWPGANEPIDRDVVVSKFATLAKDIGGLSAEDVAEGFVKIAVL